MASCDSCLLSQVSLAFGREGEPTVTKHALASHDTAHRANASVLLDPLRPLCDTQAHSRLTHGRKRARNARTGAAGRSTTQRVAGT